MAVDSKLVPMRPKPARGGSPLTPELKEFIDRAIVPALVNQYLAELDEQKIHSRDETNLAERHDNVSDFESRTAAPTLRGAVRP